MFYGFTEYMWDHLQGVSTMPQQLNNFIAISTLNYLKIVMYHEHTFKESILKERTDKTFCISEQECLSAVMAARKPRGANP